MESLERRIGAIEDRLRGYPEPTQFEQHNRERIVILETHRAADVEMMTRVMAQLEANNAALGAIQVGVATLTAGMSGRIGSAAWSYVAGGAVVLGVVGTILKLAGVV